MQKFISRIPSKILYYPHFKLFQVFILLYYIFWATSCIINNNKKD